MSTVVGTRQASKVTGRQSIPVMGSPTHPQPPSPPPPLHPTVIAQQLLARSDFCKGFPVLATALDLTAVRSHGTSLTCVSVSVYQFSATALGMQWPNWFGLLVS